MGCADFMFPFETQSMTGPTPRTGLLHFAYSKYMLTCSYGHICYCWMRVARLFQLRKLPSEANYLIANRGFARYGGVFPQRRAFGGMDALELREGDVE